jgi:hypothetical protein
MLKLLVQYETELTASRHVMEEAQKILKERETPLHLVAASESETGRPGLYEAAEADYAEFVAVLHPTSPQEMPAALDRAIATIHRIASRGR